MSVEFLNEALAVSAPSVQPIVYFYALFSQFLV